jgi:DMSO/TMAO reductase YedYZ molybdopterin-dependent catalytic subunit
MSDNSIRAPHPSAAENRVSLILVLTAALCLPCAAKYCLDPPPVTPNDEFFILGVAPEVPPGWKLDIDGEVEQPLSLSLDQLKQYPQSNVEATLECDFSSGPPLLVGNAVWSGVSLKSLLERTVLKSSAHSILFWAIDGYRRGPLPLNDVLQRSDVLVATGMNSEPLPEIQGRPARIVLPGHTGYQWVRWLDRIEISSLPPTEHFRQWPIHARILDPAYDAVLAKCPFVIKGMANAGNGTEIVKVEVSTDNGETWQDAELLIEFVPNVWRHWQYEWTIETPGQHTILARVTDEYGNVQSEDGPYGWRGYQVVVTVDPAADCPAPRRADMNKDLFVDFHDFTVLAHQWLLAGNRLSGDLIPSEGDGEVGFPDLVLIADEWLRCLVPAATGPSPADGQEDVALERELAWLPQENATCYDVYWGLDACAVAAATHASKEFLGTVAENSVCVNGVLQRDTIYYWRVDQIGPRCTASGRVWRFKTTGDSSTPSQ